MIIHSVRSKTKKLDCLRESHPTQEVDSLGNPTSSNNLNEGLHSLGSNCFITDSPYDIKNLLLNKPKLYRILYDANIDMYMIGDGSEIIHWDMIREAYKQGYYANQEEFIEELGGALDNYVDTGMHGLYDDDYEIDPYLLYMVFSPDDDFGIGEDGYDGELKFNFGSLFLRDADQGLMDNCDLIRILQKQSWANESYESELKENMNNGYRMDNGMIEDDYFTFERDNITYHFFYKPTRRTDKGQYGILAVDYGIRFDKEPYKDERGHTIIPMSRAHDKPQQLAYFEFNEDTHPEIAYAMTEDDRKEYRDLVVAETKKHINDSMMGESNELEQRAKKHKKKSKGMGWHMSMNAGNVEKGIEVFNNSTGNVGTGDTGMSMGESVEKKVYQYIGPVYYKGMLYRERVNLLTKATTRGRALANILYQVADGTELQYFDIEDNLLEEMPDNKETFTCDNCGHPLNDMGQCPACDQGEEELYEDLSSLEALWELSKLDNNV